ncbi:Toll/interleukin-1 receptor homology (TIR) domain [Propionibacterium ruminifibrarum]|uniref:Toll/interleukin-1 receptor homology (TIR) domain n=1 Tax=Propionibacterium ruminifibrarum TaxID=1962131 RepID=A0A375I818_9ACTN|nr:SAVED domain-containing protein [Propionibacterium ruminifibrarum]SPF69430.1 Toll/interleukin-1 receptor homology (TIR) domain [Propionibacterium ruminifibrarum]
MPAVTTKYDARGPVFISYRHSDGEKIADRLAWLLRAAGIPVWRDKEDLTTGSIEARIEEAMGNGLSGGVLVVTPDVENSEIIQTLEATGLLDLLENNQKFSLTLVNAVSNGERLDINEPDRVLRKPEGTLSEIMQFMAKKGPDGKTFDGLKDSDQKQFITAYVKDHLAALAADTDAIELNIETRPDDSPNSSRAKHHFDMVLPDSEDEPIRRQSLEDLQAVLGIVRGAIANHGASLLRVSGHAHLSVAFALGAQFPETLIGRAEVTDNWNKVWPSGPAGTGEFVTEVASGEDNPSESGELAVYVDLRDDISNKAFNGFLDTMKGRLRAWSHLRLAQPGWIDPLDGAAIAKQITDHIRAMCGAHGIPHVHLFLRGPYAVAFLIGRLVNTLSFTVYEYDKNTAQYVPALDVTTARAGGVIKEVLAPEPTEQS